MKATASGPPKLDRIQDQKQLMAVWASVHHHPVKQARAWFPDRPQGYVRAAQDIGNYASNRAALLLCRARGDATGAKVYKLICDSILNDLPPWAARWAVL